MKPDLVLSLIILALLILVCWVDRLEARARRRREKERLATLTDLVSRVNAATIAEMKQIQADARAEREKQL